MSWKTTPSLWKTERPDVEEPGWTVENRRQAVEKGDPVCGSRVHDLWMSSGRE